MRNRIRSVISQSLRLPVEHVPEDCSADQLPQWDSLAHLELMLALEMEFGVKIRSEVMLDLRSIESIEEFLAGAGSGKN